MNSQTMDYYRARELAERDAAGKATCEQARWAHEQMADAYARLVEIAALKARRTPAADKVVTIADVLRDRGDAEYGRRSLRLRTDRAVTGFRI